MESSIYVVLSLIYSTNSVSVGASPVYDEAHWLAVPLISSLEPCYATSDDDDEE